MLFGKRQTRAEDDRLIRGKGRYVDDIKLPGMLHVAFVRSEAARAHVKVDVEAARSAPGVHAVFIPAAVAVLCFTMGLQNALITKISRAEIRTTHVTGIVTDIGIELGKALSGAQANAAKLRLLGGLLLAFACGGFVGALAFQAVGYAATLPLAAFLSLLGAVPAYDDLGRLRAR